MPKRNRRLQGIKLRVDSPNLIRAGLDERNVDTSRLSEFRVRSEQPIPLPNNRDGIAVIRRSYDRERSEGMIVLAIELFKPVDVEGVFVIL